MSITDRNVFNHIAYLEERRRYEAHIKSRNVDTGDVTTVSVKLYPVVVCEMPGCDDPATHTLEVQTSGEIEPTSELHRLCIKCGDTLYKEMI